MPRADAGLVTAAAGRGVVGDAEMGCSVEVLLYHSYSITCDPPETSQQRFI